MQNTTNIEENSNNSSDQTPPQGGDGPKKKEQKYKTGEMLTFVRVRFPGNAKSHPFLASGKRKYSYGQKVIAMSDRGMTVGYINSFPYQAPFHESMLPIQTISKVATDDDLKNQNEFAEDEKKAEEFCLDAIKRLKLDMTITHVEFIQFGKKAVFYFNAPSRVDFRQLVKDLVSHLKMRIELRQISIRDRTASLGGIGACSRQTCCSSFLKSYNHTGIKMAKNQNLAIIPSKINGICGQPKCCLRYEDHVYSEKRKRLPKEGSFIKTKNGDLGKVLKLHLLVEEFEMLTDSGKRRRYTGDQFNPKNPPPKDWKFPEKLNHIVNETKYVIGKNNV